MVKFLSEACWSFSDTLYFFLLIHTRIIKPCWLFHLQLCVECHLPPFSVDYCTFVVNALPPALLAFWASSFCLRSIDFGGSSRTTWSTPKMLLQIYSRHRWGRVRQIFADFASSKRILPSCFPGFEFPLSFVCKYSRVVCAQEFR
jgi:hypothetical protein